MCRVGENLPQKAKQRRRPPCQGGGRKGQHSGLSRTQGCLKAACIDPGPLPLLRAGHCCPGGLAFHSRPGGERGIWGSPVCHLALPPQLIPHQRDPATCWWPPDALRLADGKALTQSARHRRPQKAWMLEWHLSQGSGGLSTPARLTHLPGVEP